MSLLPSRREMMGITAASLASALSTQATAQSTSIPPSAPAHLSGNPAAPFATQAWGPQGKVNAGAYSVERVVFKSSGTDVVGNLFMPSGAGTRPAITVIGPVAYIKEQAPLQYASRLAREGFAVLIFDPRYHGESGGEPRRLESRKAKVEDLRASLTYLSGRPDIDSRRLNILGVCQGVNWAVEAAADDPRAKSLAIVAGHYLMPETAALYLGNAENAAARIARALSARETFEKTGQVDYIPIVSLTDRDALLTAKPIHDFYYHWADRGPFAAHRGLWENRITRLSEADIWGHRIDEQLRRLEKPVLMVHSDRAASGPQIPRKLFDHIASKDKQQVWLNGHNQIQFYQDPLTIDMVTPHLAGFFREKSA